MITTEHLSVGQLAILKRIHDDDELYPLFSHHRNGTGYMLTEVRWASDLGSPRLADVRTLLEADLVEIDWEDEDDGARRWFFALTDDGEQLITGEH